MKNEIKGKLNTFKFIGVYDNTTGEWRTGEFPEETEDFRFELFDDGTCYIETNQKFEYDERTGCLYLITEV